jgi:hypothetical protein
MADASCGAACLTGPATFSFTGAEQCYEVPADSGAGGGASDVRTLPSSQGVNSLNSRILVADGGGGGAGGGFNLSTGNEGASGGGGAGSSFLAPFVENGALATDATAVPEVTIAPTPPAGDSCTIHLAFAPQGSGARQATLVIGSNDRSVRRSSRYRGRGELPRGPAGATGASGATGAVGASGSNGSPGEVELVTCKVVTKKVTRKVHGKRRKVKVKRQVCTAKLVPGPVKFTAAAPR